MDVAALVNSFSTGTYSVTRRTRSSSVAGRAVDGTESTVTISASVSPASGDDMERLPEGRRSSGAICVYTTTQLMLGDQDGGFEADRIAALGKLWEVAHVEYWLDPRSGSAAYRAVATAMA